MDVRVKFGDSMLNNGRIIRLFAGCIVLHTIVQYLIVFCSRRDKASVVISGRFVELIIPDIYRHAKFRYHRLNLYR